MCLSFDGLSTGKKRVVDWSFINGYRVGEFKVRKVKLITSAIALTLGMGLAEVAMAAPPSAEEMWKIIQQQQEMINELKAKLDNTDQKVEATQEKVVANTKAVESVEDEVASVEESSSSFAGDTTVGGYGELHYNNLDGKENQVDFHRFVLFFGHEFADDLRFFSELEVEHAFSGEGKPGEVELEQAFIEYDINPNHHVLAGLYLVPVGIINETHEPPTFYGVERNAVEKNIIPSTWWEAGIGLNGDLAPGWKYDLMLSSGLDSPTSSFSIRSGRKKVAKAPGEDGALTGRIRYTGVPGLEVGVALQHQMDITQGDQDIDANLLEAHVDYERNGFGLRALYASWWLDDGDAGIGPKAIGADRQDGFYIEPSYKFKVARGEFGVFARYQEWNNKAGGNGGDDKEQIDIGFNYWPVEDVVLKFDYQFLNDAAGDNDGFNLGIGYQF